MLIGILYALAATALWGFVFVIPGLLNDFTSMEVAFGRTAFFGFFCLGLLLGCKRHLMTISLKPLWYRAFALALVANIIHYIFLVLSTRYAHPALATMLLGIAPITIVLYGNFRTKKIPLIQILPFCTLILFGLILLTFPPLLQIENTSATFLYGVIFGLLALATWTWYIVVNALTMQENPALNPSDWVTLLGSATLILTLVAVPLYLFVNPSLQRNPAEVLPFLAGTAFLGIGSSWLANYFWNQATVRLPLTMIGTLSIFETLFGLFYVYLLNAWTPNNVELTGIVCILGGVFATLRFSHNFLIEKKI